MEAYKTVCPDCGHIRNWVGYKTGVGKTAEQLAQMRKDETTCVNCGSTNAKTDLAHASPAGQILDNSSAAIIGILGKIISDNPKEESSVT